MKKRLYLWQFSGFLFTGITGILLHFLYEWTSQNRIVALFSAVNESIWEHMKLLFFPMLIFAIIESRYIGNKYGNFWCAKLVGIVLGVSIIPILYYTYTGIFGITVDWFNIAIFFIAAATSYIVETNILKNQKTFFFSCGVAKVILFFIIVLFVIFTFTPPEIALFQDPATKLYGISI